MKKLLLSSIFIFCFSIFAFAQTQNLPCPKIEIQGPTDLVTPGDLITFTANVDKKELNFESEFEWKVSQGEIVQGQGTREIRVETTMAMENSDLNVMVKLKKSSENCKNEASKITAIGSLPCGLISPLDQYEKLTLEDQFLRTDVFLISLANNPGTRGYMLFEIEKTENLDNVKNRLTKIFEHIFEKRKFNRILMFYDVCYAEKTLTTSYIIPEENPFPSLPVGCEKVDIDLK